MAQTRRSAMTHRSLIELSPHPVAGTSRGIARRLALTLWVAATLLAVAAIVIVIATLSTPAPEAGYLRGSVALFAFAWSTIGARIATRHSRNAVGWLMLAAGLGFAVIAVTQELVIAALLGPHPVQGAEITVRLVRISGFLTSLAAGLTILLFPDGQFPSRRWIAVGVLVIACNALGAAIAALAPLPSLVGSANPFLEAENAYFKVPLYGLARYGGPLALAAGGGALLARLRGSRGAERQQLKWVTAGGGLALTTNLIANVIPAVALLQVVQLLSLLAIPVTVGIAMARYRLYDIDTILNRTLVYVILSAFLAGLTAALLAITQRLFIVFTGQSSDAAIVITTLILVGVLGTTQQVIQRAVDRRFKSAGRGLTGLPTFATEVRQFAGLSDPQRLLMRLLSESVAAFGATGGAVELGTTQGRMSTQTVGEWDGDTRVTTTINDGMGKAARLRLGPRSSGEAYSKPQIAQLRDAADAVAEALERRPAVSRGLTGGGGARPHGS